MISYFSLVKFAHTVFALPFALLAFFLAIKSDGSAVDWTLLVLIILCMVFARSAAMAFNRFVDRKIDALNARTVVREIPSGVIHPKAALRLVIFMSLAFIVTTYWINPLCFYLSPVALLVILGYSYTKRYTWLCHYVLGLGLGLAPIGAFIAVTGRFEILPVLYGIMVLFWVSSFDILYALQDEEFDKAQGLHSVPQFFGKVKAKRMAISGHVLCILLLGYITWFQGQAYSMLEVLHWIGAAGFALLLCWQHYLVYRYDLEKINHAFFTTNGVASIIFGAAGILDVLI